LLAYEVPLAQGPWPDRGDDAHAEADALADAVREVLRRQAALFVGVQETTSLLTRASADLPDVVKEVLRALPMQKVAEVLRRLVAEEVSVRNLRDILEALAEAGQREKDVQALTEFARIALKRQISHRVAAKDGRLNAILLRPEVEDLLRQAVRTNGGVSQLALETDVARALVASVRGLVDRLQPHALVSSVDLRWHLRKLIEPECFDTPVLSFHELAAHLRIEVVAHVAVPGSTYLEAA
jgi:type III secretion protein V